MPIWAKAAPNYPVAPAGTHAAICVDVIDMGMLKVEYNGQAKMVHKIRIVWQIDEDRDDGKPFQVSKRYTNSLHEKATLRGDLEAWRGRPFTEAELTGFDLEVLIGIPALLNLIHTAKNGSTYANIASLMRLPRAMSAPTQREYVRVCDREPAESQPVPAEENGTNFVTDEDVPF